MNELGRVYLAGGHVYCARRRDDCDVSQCLGCESLKELNKQSSPPYVVCDAVRGTADPFFVSWWHQHHRRSRTV